jgi:hypothetical protein
MAYQRKITSAKKWTNARRRNNERARMAREHRWAADQENMSEADNTNGSHIYKVLENVITGVRQYRYNRRITFQLDNDKVYQFVATMGHDGDHDWGEPYEVEAYQETVTKYRKK